MAKGNNNLWGRQTEHSAVNKKQMRIIGAVWSETVICLMDFWYDQITTGNGKPLLPNDSVQSKIPVKTCYWYWLLLLESLLSQKHLANLFF